MVIIPVHGASAGLQLDCVDTGEEEDGDGSEHFVSVFGLVLIFNYNRRSGARFYSTIFAGINLTFPDCTD